MIFVILMIGLFYCFSYANVMTSRESPQKGKRNLPGQPGRGQDICTQPFFERLYFR